MLLSFPSFIHSHSLSLRISMNVEVNECEALSIYEIMYDEFIIHDTSTDSHVTPFFCCFFWWIFFLFIIVILRYRYGIIFLTHLSMKVFVKDNLSVWHWRHWKASTMNYFTIIFWIIWRNLQCDSKNMK